MANYDILFLLLIPLAACLYASVGHGGASAYLALMALFSFEPLEMKSTALILNLFVSGIAFYEYWNRGFFSWKLFYPFALTSIPAAFISASFSPDASIYRIVLAILLFASIPRLLMKEGKSGQVLRSPSMAMSLFAGLIIGSVSGFIGIGGGILLSPLLLLFHWAGMKETAAVSALFIWVNSLAGIGGMYFGELEFSNDAIFLALLAMAGGLAGSYFGSSRLNAAVLKKILASVLLIAGIKLMLL